MFINRNFFVSFSQTCALEIESWRYSHAFMEFTFANSAPELKFFRENEQWELVSTSQRVRGVEYRVISMSFDHVEFVFVIRRKIMYYM